jgi:NitT/TauT family transport system substrate-binding protein
MSPELNNRPANPPSQNRTSHMSSTPENPNPGSSVGNQPGATPGTTRIVAGEAGKPRRKRTLEISLAAGLVLLIGAGAAVASTVSRNNEAAAAPAATAGAAAADANPAAELRLGYFGNITHAPALVGVSKGLIAKDLGGTKLSTQVFNAGPAAIEALNAGAIDATYIGPNPAINSYVKSAGESVSIIAGAASGGAQLVVQPGITSAADLKGKTLASPQLGGTQDVALRAWLAKQGYKTSTDGSGDVAINPTENAQTLKLFQDGKLDGAWLPEPWASRLVLQAGAKVLVDEKDLWDKGEFITTVLIVNKKFAAEHPATVKALLKGHVESVDWLNAAPAAEKATVLNAALKESAGATLPADVIDRSLKNIAFTVDPLAGTYKKLLQDGVDAGTTKQADISGIFDLTALNAVTGKKTSAGGLGKD